MCKRITAALLVFALLISLALFSKVINGTAASAEASGKQSDKNYNESAYADYIKSLNDVPAAIEEIKFTAGNLPVAGGQYVIAEDGIMTIPEGGNATLCFTLKSSALYNIELEYYPEPERAVAPQMMLYINGSVPFKEAKSFKLMRLWKDKTGIQTDSSGNDLRPQQVDLLKWMRVSLTDSSGYHTEPLQFAFRKGENLLNLQAVRENLIIKSITLKVPVRPPSYEDYIKQYSDVPNAEITIPIQTENTASKSDPTLTPIADRISPLTYPNRGSKISRNMIGGERWTIPGQVITWSFHAKETGLYQIQLRARQNYSEGFYSTRILTIDGEVPFREMETVEFKYSDKWQTIILGGENPYRFYLTEGDHEIAMTVTLGNFGQILKDVQQCVDALNNQYRKLFMFIGSNPDIYRDYDIDVKYPEMIDAFSKQAEILDGIYSRLKAEAGFTGSDLAIINKLSRQLKGFADKPYSIASGFVMFKNNISALYDWLNNAIHRPLDIDWIRFEPVGSPLERADANIFELIAHGLKMFLASFFEDYDSFDTGTTTTSSIEVWTTSGRDQSLILSDLIRSDFTPQTGISVKLKLVQMDIVLPSTVVGNGPDVLLNMGTQMPVNFAMRKGAKDLTGMDGFAEVIKRFPESAVTPARYNGGVYALPESVTFNMMFYRSDILNELQIEPPQTWDDLLKILPILQRKNMDIVIESGMSTKDLAASSANVGFNSVKSGVDVGLSTFAMFSFQRGGRIYSENGDRSMLSSKENLDAFLYWTRLYTNHGLSYNVNPANRFRTGESPIAITDYSLYNVLMAFAPEIDGLWEMAPVPGIRKPHGTIDRSVRSIPSYSFITAGAKDETACWKFMDWWTSVDIQRTYAGEMESVLGASARYPTSNLEALEKLPWSLKDYNSLKEQLLWAKGVPELPGGYYTSRHVNNALRDVVINGEDPRETLTNFNTVINQEIDQKRKEFGLPLRKRGEGE